MAKDSDVARVAAAMNAPGFRYRSFGNEPVRIRPGQAGTLTQPGAQPVSQPMAMPEPYTPPPMAYEPQEMPTSEALLSSYESLPESFDLSQQAGFRMAPEPLAMAPAPMDEPMMAQPVAEPVMPSYLPPEPPMPQAPPAAVAMPVPEPAPPEPPPVPLFSWPETPAAAMPPAPAPALLPEVARAYAPQPPQAAEAAEPMPPMGGGFRLLESIGHRAGETGAARQDSVAGGTLGMLRSAIASGPAESTMAGILAGSQGGASGGAGFVATAGLSLGNTSGQMAGLLAAASVTVPLSDVMRLIAAGATPPPSPFDAFRAALGAQPGR